MSQIPRVAFLRLISMHHMDLEHPLLMLLINPQPRVSSRVCLFQLLGRSHHLRRISSHRDLPDRNPSGQRASQPARRRATSHRTMSLKFCLDLADLQSQWLLHLRLRCQQALRQLEVWLLRLLLGVAVSRLLQRRPHYPRLLWGCLHKLVLLRQHLPRPLRWFHQGASTRSFLCRRHVHVLDLRARGGIHLTPVRLQLQLRQLASRMHPRRLQILISTSPQHHSHWMKSQNLRRKNRNCHLPIGQSPT